MIQVTASLGLPPRDTQAKCRLVTVTPAITSFVCNAEQEIGAYTQHWGVVSFLGSMQPGDPVTTSPGEIRDQLARILRSARFVRAKRSAELLEFIVSEHLAGDRPPIKEYRIGEAVYNRAAFDPSQDTLVRTNVMRLRKALAEYYKEEGAEDRVIIEIPKGHYLPEFFRRKGEEPPPEPGRKSRWALAILAALMASGVFYLGFRSPPTVSPGIRPVPRQRRMFATSTAEGGRIRHVALPRPAESLLLTPDNRKLYALAVDGRSLFVVNARSLEFEREIGLPRESRAPRFSADAARIYLASPERGLLVVDTANDRVSPSMIPTAQPVHDLAIAADGRTAYLGLGDYGLSRLDLKTGETRVLSSMRWVGYLALDHAAANLYIGWQGGGPGGRPGHDAVEAIDVRTGRTARIIRPAANVGSRLIVSPGDEVVLIGSEDACRSPDYDHIGCPGVPSQPFYVARRGGGELPDQVAIPGFSGATEFFPLTNRVHLAAHGDSVIWQWGRQRVLERIEAQGKRSAVTSTEERIILSAPAEPVLRVFEAEPAACLPPEAGLRNWYPGDGSTDDAQSGGQLNVEGQIGYRPGLSGQAFVFDGVVFLRAKGGTPWCVLCEHAMTEAFFVNFDAASAGGTLLEAAASGPWPGRRIARQGDHLIFESTLAAGQRLMTRGLVPVTAGRWVHVALVSRENRRTFFVDGVWQGEQAAGSLLGSEAVTLGARALGGHRDWFRGRMDEIVTYDRALSDREILALARRPDCSPVSAVLH